MIAIVGFAKAAWTVLGGRGVAIIGGALAAVALLIGVYQAGKIGERKRGEAVQLRATIKEMERLRDVALDIQTRMAANMAELRADYQEQEAFTNELVKEFSTDKPAPAGTKPAPVGCRYCLSDYDRMRLRRIRIGAPRNPGR